MDLTRLRQINEQKASDATDNQRHQELLLDNTKTQQVIAQSIASLVDFLDKKVTKTEVINQLREISTPDVEQVVTAVESLHDTLRTHENTDLTEITDVMRSVLEEVKGIPKQLPDAPDKPVDYSERFKSLESTIKTVETAVKNQKLHVEAPIVNVPQTQVNVDAPDLTPISVGLDDVKKAVKAIVIPKPEKTDLTPVEKELKKTNKLLTELPSLMPRGGGGGGSTWIATNTNGIPVPLEQTPSGALATDSQALAVRIDDTTTANTTYIGKAVIGSAASSAVWQIAKLDTSSGLIKTWADGDALYNNIWDNRATTINYS